MLLFCLLLSLKPQADAYAWTDPGAGSANAEIQVDAAGGVMSFVYGANSGGNAFDSSGFKPTWAQDASGYVTEVVNDTFYRTTDKTITYGDGLPPAPIQYDIAGNPAQETDPLGRITVKATMA